jgi:hypothetical protein
MKHRSFIMQILLAGFILMFPLYSIASDNPKGKELYPTTETQKGKTVITPSSDDQKEKPFQKDLESSKKPITTVSMPVYKPPLRGAPGGRIGGGSRGVEKELTAPSVLAPDHVGLTFQEQPNLYWYLPKSTSYPIEVTIIEDQAVYPLVEKRINLPVKPGIQHISLKEYDVHLSIGKQYRWFVALVSDPDHRSRDIVAGGIIERIELPESFRVKLAQTDRRETPNIYAEEGIWYDALMAISDLINASPNDTILHKQRASLLEQVGLPEIAEYEMKQGSPVEK